MEPQKRKRELKCAKKMNLNRLIFQIIFSQPNKKNHPSLMTNT